MRYLIWNENFHSNMTKGKIYKSLGYNEKFKTYTIINDMGVIDCWFYYRFIDVTKIEMRKKKLKRIL